MFLEVFGGHSGAPTLPRVWMGQKPKCQTKGTPGCVLGWDPLSSLTGERTPWLSKALKLLQRVHGEDGARRQAEVLLRGLESEP